MTPPRRPKAGQLAQPTGAKPISVMVVDDSAVIRGMLSRILDSEPDIQVITSASNGKFAIESLTQFDPQVIILDIEMPVMDGLTALPEILKKRPNVNVVMASTLTAKNAAISLRALSAGASDYVTKPSSVAGLRGADDFKRELVEKVRALGGGVAAPGRVSRPVARAPKPFTQTGKSARAPSIGASAEIKLRPKPLFRPTLMVIGASTGGPQALFSLFEELKNRINVPILVTQHMPPTFTTILAERLGAISGLDAQEAKDGEPLARGTLRVAPGNFHMIVSREKGQDLLRLTSTPPENFCRPAVDPLFRSVAEIFGNKVLAIVLTGMGADGAKGATQIAEAGGGVIAQDEATSVVWGMPGATASAGICNAVLPLPEIPGYIRKTFAV